MTTDLAPLTDEQVQALKAKNVSDSIRYLDSEGFERAEIARILGKRYQHVRHVLVRSTESGVRRKTLTFSVLAETIEEFRTSCKALGRHADRHLNQVLNQGFGELAERVPNSPETEALLIEHYKSEFEAFSNVTETVKLESPLVDKIRKECERMHVPVDFFVTGSLETANDCMDQATKIINYPFEHLKGSGQDHLSHFFMNDRKARKLQAWRIDDELLFEAVAFIKDVSINVAARSVSELSRDEKEKMKKNPDIREIMLRLKSKELTLVDLDDLL